MTPIYVSLGTFAGILGIIFVTVLLRSTFKSDRTVGVGDLAGLALPKGSVRGLLAFLVLGSFVIFVFFGNNAVNEQQFDTVLTAFATLTGAVTGFYFGTRGSGG